MHLTYREWWALIHGIIFGAFFLLAFSGGLAGLWSLRTEWVTAEGLRERVRRLKIGTVTMALAAWGTVITGTWIVYPWYRSKSPDSPKSKLTADPSTADWHTFGWSGRNTSLGLRRFWRRSRQAWSSTTVRRPRATAPSATLRSASSSPRSRPPPSQASSVP